MKKIARWSNVASFLVMCLNYSAAFVVALSIIYANDSPDAFFWWMRPIQIFSALISWPLALSCLIVELLKWRFTVDSAAFDKRLLWSHLSYFLIYSGLFIYSCYVFWSAMEYGKTI